MQTHASPVPLCPAAVLDVIPGLNALHVSCLPDAKAFLQKLVEVHEDTGNNPCPKLYALDLSDVEGLQDSDVQKVHERVNKFKRIYFPPYLQEPHVYPSVEDDSSASDALGTELDDDIALDSDEDW